MQAQQQYQEIMAQATLQQHLQTQGRERRTSLGFNPPATAGPMTNSFDLRAATLSAQMRRANQTDQIHSQLAVSAPSDDYLPMTTTFGGRFGGRTISGSLHAPNFEHPEPPPTPNSTTVISGGTFLGHSVSNTPSPQVATPSKSDSASSWRRGGNNSVLGANRTVSSPSLKVTPPNDEEYLSPFFSAGGSSASLGGLKTRPQPLRFGPSVSQSLPTVAIDTTDDDADSSGSSEKSILSNSSATSPHSSASNEMPLSPREEASKRLYEGLGIGRPVSSTPSDGGYPHLTVSLGPGRRMVSQPTRQPRGPPSGDELGLKNFATRIRRKAIGGLGVLRLIDYLKLLPLFMHPSDQSSYRLEWYTVTSWTCKGLIMEPFSFNFQSPTTAIKWHPKIWRVSRMLPGCTTSEKRNFSELLIDLICMPAQGCSESLFRKAHTLFATVEEEIGYLED